MICPVCGSECIQEEVDIGVGILTGSWYCTWCGWDQRQEIDKLFKGQTESKGRTRLYQLMQ